MKLTIKNISKSYEQTKILNNVSISLTPGIYGVLGANGAGKTTLFRIICGIMTPTTGEIIYNDKNIQANLDSYRSIMGFLPQDFRYYDDFSAMKFMLYISALKGLNRGVAKQRSTELLELVGLHEVKNKKIKNK